MAMTVCCSGHLPCLASVMNILGVLVNGECICLEVYLLRNILALTFSVLAAVRVVHMYYYASASLRYSLYGRP